MDRKVHASSEDICGSLVSNDLIADNDLVKKSDFSERKIETKKTYEKVIHAFKNKKINFASFIEDMFASVKGAHLESHTMGVAKISLELAQYNGFSPLEQSLIFWAAFLHDLGKVHIPDEIISSPHRLNDWQYYVIKMHPLISERLAKEIPLLTEKHYIDGHWISVCDIIRYHHEKEDGSGYEGVEVLNKFNKILNIADAFEAMRDATRKFNAERSTGISNVLNRMYYDIGTHFDKKYLKSFIKMLKHKGENKQSFKPDWLKKKITGKNFFFTLWSEGMEYQPDPDYTCVNSIFTDNQPMVSIENLMAFIAEFVNRERYLETWVNGDKYRIEIEAEPYIINQEPDKAKISIYKNNELVAKIEQDKFLRSKELFIEKTGMQNNEVKNDFLNAGEFISTAAGQFYFNNLNMTEQGFKDVLKKYGAITVDELRVFVEAQLDRENPLKVKEVLDVLMSDLIAGENVAVSGRNITVLDSVDIALSNSADLFSDHEKVKRELEKYFSEKYIENVYTKREKIFAFWQEVKHNTIRYVQIDTDKFSSKEQAQVLPLIDYISKLNLRCVPVEKVKETVNGVVREDRNLLPEEKLLKEHIVYNSLLFNYFIEISGLLDSSFIRMTKNHEDNRSKNYIKSFVMSEHYPELTLYLDNVVGKYEYREIGVPDELLDNIKLIDMIYEFIGSNGHIDYIFNYDRFQLSQKERELFFKWLLKHDDVVNTQFKDAGIWDDIKRLYQKN